MTLHRAAWVLPISRPPVPDGAVAIATGRIVSIGPFDRLRKEPHTAVIDHGDAVLLPGLVNAHTHLEWSFLRGQVSPDLDFVAWMREITSRRLSAPQEAVSEAIGDAVKEIQTTGTVAVGEVINNVNPGTVAAAGCLAASGLLAVVFVELIQFQGERAEKIFDEGRKFLQALRDRGPSLTYHLSPHAPYSVSPALFRRIKDRSARRAVHVAENEAEVRLLKTGDGLWREILEARGRWDASWTPPGVSPVRYLDDLGFLDDRTLAVHVVRVDDDDIAILRRRGTPVCLCPRSNARLQVGRAPARKLFDAGLTVALGTDSLASSDDLDMFAEMRALRDQNPDLTAEETVRSATLGGAVALGLGGELGSLEPGKSARLIGVKAGRNDDPYEALLRENSTVFFPLSKS